MCPFQTFAMVLFSLKMAEGETGLSASSGSLRPHRAAQGSSASLWASDFSYVSCLQTACSWKQYKALSLMHARTGCCCWLHYTHVSKATCTTALLSAVWVMGLYSHFYIGCVFFCTSWGKNVLLLSCYWDIFFTFCVRVYILVVCLCFGTELECSWFTFLLQNSEWEWDDCHCSCWCTDNTFYMIQLQEFFLYDALSSYQNMTSAPAITLLEQSEC